jgi:hypothetical protein
LRWDGFDGKEQPFEPRDFSPGLRCIVYALLPLAKRNSKGTAVVAVSRI